MRNSLSSKVIRIAAGITGIVILLVLLFSAYYVALEADHDCSGEDCLICARIEQCESLLRRLSADLVQKSSAVIQAVSIVLTVSISAEVLLQDTLVSRKIRLNN